MAFVGRVDLCSDITRFRFTTVIAYHWLGQGDVLEQTETVTEKVVALSSKYRIKLYGT